jgi:hypothetical protein
MRFKRDDDSATENELEFLFELYIKGVPIGEEKEALLRRKGYIKEEQKEKKFFNPKPTINRLDFKLDKKSELENFIDSAVTVSENNGDENINIRFFDGEEKPNTFFESGRTIGDDEWKPKSTTVHTDEFIEWIDSINSGFQFMKYYRPFEMYVLQSKTWLQENISPSTADTPEERIDMEDMEIDRCARNTLYFADRYGRLKEGSMLCGIRIYQATRAHQVILFLLDAGYSFYVAKPRQIAATTTFGLAAIKKTIFIKNHFIKFVTQDDKKGKEIFADKMVYPFAEIPEWMKPHVSNDRENLFRLGEYSKKGDKEGVNSKIEVVAPTKTAISGGAPQLSLIDEAGNIEILQEIIQDARPTMYWMNPATGKIELKRQLVAWGTGGEMEKGGKAFESVFMTQWNLWKHKDFTSGVIPIFLDWTTRPGITKEFYEKEKAAAYSVEGPKSKEARILFHQQYPSSIEEVFLTTAKTLVDIEFIESNLNRIRTAFNKDKQISSLRPRRGYFEPVFGNEPQGPNSDVPFNIIGANFVPTGDNDPRATACIFLDPDFRYENRYFQGTDPIASDNGLSKMASVIWDAKNNTLAGYVMFRDQDYKYVFLQCMLLGIFYDRDKQGVKEILESNIGLAYREYKDVRGFFNTLVFNSELPQYLQTGSGNIIGIDNRGARNKMIIDKMFEVFQSFSQNIYIEEPFIQLKTFTCSITKNGNETWGPIDRRLYDDDLLFAITFAYICALCYSANPPVMVSENEDRRLKVKFVLERDKEWNLVRVAKRMPER